LVLAALVDDKVLCMSMDGRYTRLGHRARTTRTERSADEPTKQVS
jgi:hypothetical protein